MATEGNGKVIHLTKAEFLAKVYNFEKNPEEWKYEGDKPAIVDFFLFMICPFFQQNMSLNLILL